MFRGHKTSCIGVGRGVKGIGVQNEGGRVSLC